MKNRMQRMTDCHQAAITGAADLRATRGLAPDSLLTDLAVTMLNGEAEAVTRLAPLCNVLQREVKLALRWLNELKELGPLQQTAKLQEAIDKLARVDSDVRGQFQAELAFCEDLAGRTFPVDPEDLQQEFFTA